MRAFFGYLRQATDGRTWHLYLSLDLDDYIEIDEQQILHSVAFEGSQYPLGGSLVWVRRSTKLRRVGVVTTEAQADFLRGDIAGNHVAMSTVLIAKNPPIGTGPLCTSYTGCTPCFTEGPMCGRAVPEKQMVERDRLG